ncbi:ethanolamine kinase [Thraustotheca clavata]|uniref:ethanolamine kinase n=1 Tax=Thraustotheca clavata TaxID=74557 RepID=A0A1V9ZK46_9STRA|nr:ethanolamine kinase [Thraustotheca clavata]
MSTKANNTNSSMYLNNAKHIYEFTVGGRGEHFEFDDCKDVVKHICPAWRGAKNDDITVKIICGGITNRLYRLIWKDLCVLVRLYGEHTEVFIDRNVDNENFADLSRRGFAPTYFGRFTNGRVEGWVDGSALEPHQMSETTPYNLLSLIPKELGKMHAMEVDMDTSPCLWKKIQQFEDLASKIVFEDPIKRDGLEKLQLSVQYQIFKQEYLKHTIKQRVQWLQSVLPSHKNNHGKDLMNRFRGSQVAKLAYSFLHDSVFSHNDLLSGNILFNPSWGRVQIIDYEYGSYNYRGFDFGNHFCEHCGFDMNLNDYPSKEKQLIFYKAYLTTANPVLLQSLTRENQLDEFLSHLYESGNLYALSAHMFWGLWAIVQADNSTIDFDFLDYARMRFEAFEMQLDQFCPTAKDV